MLRPLEGLLDAVSGRRKCEVQMPSPAISPAYGRLLEPQPQSPSPCSPSPSPSPARTYLGDAIFESLRASTLSWSAYEVGFDDASDARVDSAGSWIDALLPWRGCVDATVELLDDGRDISRPTSSGLIDGSVLVSNAGGEVVLIAGRSNACSIDGRRNVSWACGRGRIEVASAEAVMN